MLEKENQIEMRNKKMILSSAIQNFLQYLKEIQRSPATIVDYRKMLNRFNRYLCGKYNCQIYVDIVTAEDFEEFLSEELGEKSSATRFAATTAYKSFFGYCYKKGLCKDDIARKVKSIRAISKERLYISENEFILILKNIDSYLITVMLQTMYYTGMRINECVKLSLDDVDFNKWTIHIKKDKIKENRIIPVNTKLRPILYEYIKNRSTEFETNQFFIGCRGTISAGYANKVLTNAVKESGIEKNITSHIMRHSFATNLIKNGIDILRVQKLLGHRTIKTTSIYLHSNMNELKNAVELL